ncbi:MAG: polysaccharide deacetylase family protein [Chitinophagaceae bacterium]
MQYIFSFAGKEVIGENFQLTTDVEAFRQSTQPKINYTSDRVTDTEFHIHPHPLLFEKNITPQSITCLDTNGVKTFFGTEGDLSFDIFAASFYLLSRYEEYLPYKPDAYGRYAFENSLAYKEGFLDQPVVNSWLKIFKIALQKKFPSLTVHYSSFTFLPTYDIDMAWSYLHKGWKRNAGGMIRSLITGKWKELKQRINVLRRKEKDPYDAFGWMNQLHERYKLKPYYFFLVAGMQGKHDKNISPTRQAMKDLIYNQVIRYPVGIHPSWQSGDNVSLLKKEIDKLKAITGTTIQSSRQHYIRFTFPDTFRKLLENGLRFDFSMGYGSVNGFRASITTPFYWYDLANEKQTELLLFPFCFMDANSFYEQKYTAQQALEEMRHYYRAVQNVSGNLIMIWHNSFLGTDRVFAGWKEAYEQFIKETIV